MSAIAADVGLRAEAACAAWELDEVTSLGGGEVGLVCAASRGGSPVVLKVQPRGHAEEGALVGEGVALTAWSGSGAAVELLAVADGGLTLLLERLVPGRALDSTVADGMERLRALGALAARLHRSADRPPAAVTPLADYCGGWPDRLADDPEVADELTSLLTSPAEERLLHGDLHGGNALLHRGEWVAIDPHGVRGDPHADVWALVDPLSPVLDADDRAIAEAISVYAEASGLDPVRAARWARVRGTVEAATIERDAAAPTDQREWASGMRRVAAGLSAFLG